MAAVVGLDRSRPRIATIKIFHDNVEGERSGGLSHARPAETSVLSRRRTANACLPLETLGDETRL